MISNKKAYPRYGTVACQGPLYDERHPRCLWDAEVQAGLLKPEACGWSTTRTSVFEACGI